MRKKGVIYRVNIIKKQGNFFNNLNGCINTNSDSENFSLINILMNNSYPVSRKSFFPQSYRDALMFKPNGTTNSLTSLIHWCANIQKYFKDDIIKFLEYKQKFDFSILSGDYEMAENILSEIEQNICFSYWSLKNRMLLVNLKGYDIDCAIEELNMKEIQKPYAYLFAQCTSTTCDLDAYNKNVTYIINTLESDAFASYFKYLYTSDDSYSEEDFVNILDYCNAFSIIDSYIAIKFVIHSLVAASKEGSLVKDILKILSEIINDDELKTLKLVVSGNSVSCSDACADLLELFLQREFEDVIKNKEHFIKNISDCSFAKINIYSIAFAYCDDLNFDFCDKNCMLDKIIILIKDFLLCKRDFSFKNGIQTLKTYSRVLKWFDISNPLDNFIKTLEGKKPTRDDIIIKSYFVDELFLYNQIANHKVIPVFFESLIYYGENDLDYNEIESEFSATRSKIESISLIYILFYRAVERTDFDFALEIFCKSVSKYQNLIYRYELYELYKFVNENIVIHERITIGEVIFSFLINELKDFRSVTFKNFLDKIGVSKPLEIVNCKIDKDILCYFLKEVCSIKNMSALYWAFSNSTDIENHRIEICKYLLEIDKQNRNLYSKEISNIVKEQETRKLKAAIDTSKLSIDYSYIREKLHDDFAELQKRYYLTKPDAKEVVEYTSFTSDSDRLINWKYYANSREIILRKMLKKYSTEFCFGIKGIDTFLSTRVRHGTFQNTINTVFVQNSLSNTDNNFFKSMFSKGWISDDIKNAVKNFNQELNKLILDLTNKKFKVYIENFINGAIFDYNITDEDLTIIASLLLASEEQLSSLDFINIIESCIVKKTNDYLEKIRNHTLEKLKKDIIALLEGFSNEIKSFCNNNGLSKINDKIVSCQTDVQNRIDEIKNWFYLSESEPMGNFSFDELISVLKKTLQQQFDDFSKINFHISNSIGNDFFGETFVYLYDVLLILFSNAIIHSGYSDLHDLNISLTLQEIDGDNISLIVENNYSNLVNKIKVELSSKKINEIYENKEYKNVDTHREGGMGQIKVLDILFNILGIGQDFSVLCDENSYKVQIIMKRKGVIIIEKEDISS